MLDKMVCKKCNGKLILDNKEQIKCPNCLRIKFLFKEEALKVAKKQVDWFRDAFVQVLNKFEKKNY